MTLEMKPWLMCLFIASSAGCKGSSKAILTNDTSAQMYAFVTLSRGTGAWFLSFAASESVPITFSPERETGLHVTLWGDGKLKVGEIGYFESSIRRCVAFRLKFDKISHKSCSE